ncbi:hypothetical protein D3C76_1204450 [compost metagenome]
MPLLLLKEALTSSSATLNLMSCGNGMKQPKEITIKTTGTTSPLKTATTYGSTTALSINLMTELSMLKKAATASPFHGHPS